VLSGLAVLQFVEEPASAEDENERYGHLDKFIDKVDDSVTPEKCRKLTDVL